MRERNPQIFFCLFFFLRGGEVKHNKAVQHKNDMAHVGGERGTSSGRKGKRKANEKQFKLYMMINSKRHGYATRKMRFMLLHKPHAEMFWQINLRAG